MPNAEELKLKLAETSRIQLHIVTELHNLFSSIKIHDLQCHQPMNLSC